MIKIEKDSLGNILGGVAITSKTIADGVRKFGVDLPEDAIDKLLAFYETIELCKDEDAATMLAITFIAEMATALQKRNVDLSHPVEPTLDTLLAASEAAAATLEKVGILFDLTKPTT